MKSRIFRAISLGMLLSTCFWRAGSSQAATPVLEQFEVAFWPEFDRREVLVIYRFLLPADTALPAALQIDLPTRVGEPNAVAFRSDSTGELLNADFELVVGGDWTTATIQLEGLAGQLEYYDTLDIQGESRSFTFEWPGGLQVNQFNYEFQQPYGAEAIQLDPPANSQVIGNDGLTYLRGTAGVQTVDSQLQISFGYSKSDPTLSLEALQQLPPLGPVEAPQDRALDWRALLPYGLGVAGVLLIGFGLYLYLRPGIERVREPRPRRRKVRRPGVEVDPSPLYCQNCGAQAGSGDHFCRQCGTKLRR